MRKGGPPIYRNGLMTAGEMGGMGRHAPARKKKEARFKRENAAE